MICPLREIQAAIMLSNDKINNNEYDEECMCITFDCALYNFRKEKCGLINER
jgi:hypothetical protein